MYHAISTMQKKCEDATLLRMSMLSLFENEDSGFLVHAALLGEEDAMRDYLQKYPNEVIHGW